MSTLYEITGAWREVYDLAEDPDFDNEEAWFDTLEGIEGELEDKAEGYGKLIKHLEIEAAAHGAKADAIKQEAERQRKKEEVLLNRADRIKKNLQSAMSETGKTNFKTENFAFRIQANPPKLEKDPNAKVPEKYLIPQPPKINNKAILDDLKAGEVIEGFTITRGESLRIR